jgi:hypothetical protein
MAGIFGFSGEAVDDGDNADTLLEDMVLAPEEEDVLLPIEEPPAAELDVEDQPVVAVEPAVVDDAAVVEPGELKDGKVVDKLLLEELWLPLVVLVELDEDTTADVVNPDDDRVLAVLLVDEGKVIVVAEVLTELVIDVAVRCFSSCFELTRGHLDTYMC